MITTQYTELSRHLTRTLSKETKKQNGIYFTPPQTIHSILKILDPYIKSGKIHNILEPSCGSGEFLHAIISQYKKGSFCINAVENNTTIFNSIKDVFSDKMDNSIVNLRNEDFLCYYPNEPQDLIIGNPPFFVMKKHDVDTSYYPFFDGRPNIFLLFLIKSIQHLSDEGILCFVLPSNFMNSLVCDKTRQYIVKECDIIDIIECDDDYIETKQKTIVLIIQRKKPSDICQRNMKNVLSLHHHTIFGTEHTIQNIKELCEGTTTLFDMGFDVNVGSIVWNQCKPILTDDPTKTRLIYSSDIENNQLSIKTYDNQEKKNYINKRGSNEPLLVINRGYGTGKYVFQYCLLTNPDEYLIENHLICIRPVEKMTKRQLLSQYKKIITSLQNNKTNKFIQLYFGNNAINTTELRHIMPMFL